MAQEQKLADVSPLTFVILIVAASAISMLIAVGAKKMAPGTFGTIS